MNYEEMSDFEINGRVGKIIFELEGKEFRTTNPMNNVVEFIAGFGDEREFNYFNGCNNPSDAWPVIEIIWERLMQVDNYYQAHTRWEAYCIEHNVGKLRAAMICFLKTKDERNE